MFLEAKKTKSIPDMFVLSHLARLDVEQVLTSSRLQLERNSTAGSRGQAQTPSLLSLSSPTGPQWIACFPPRVLHILSDWTIEA